MDFPVVVGPMERGRQILDSLPAVNRPDFLAPSGPSCSHCGASIPDDITEKMNVHGVEYCPVCILEDVHPFANPADLQEISSRNELKSEILDSFGTPPEMVQSETSPLPGAYVLWCPPLREHELDNVYDIIKRLGNYYVQILRASNGNGLIYIGESMNVANRIWNHSRGGGALLTKVLAPTRLVAVNWKAPDVSLGLLEQRVGQQVADSVEQSGYNIEVYWN